ncbi:branched-chain amino acid transport system permease protein [Salirhabdus euzebyi]|uniref:Branched-chain amino acid transport system permease protein n=1 Tax=Salirhabdus euzebyi TaxID=394506 RepID=A0A841Q5N9_9BACI|nr:branched-chain amino acid ABC transporter permease [Salirhabdus euzebyi]MBB6453711.1 branched-chain amino acid transport system permease protein [Salirhabdus euzebyi]
MKNFSRFNFNSKYLLLILALLFFFLPTFVNSPYLIRVIEMIAIFSLLGLGLNFLFGYTGQISIGHSAFYALGAYTSAILETKFAVPFYIAWIVAIVLTGLIAYLVSFPILKLKGHYLAMATLAFVLIVETILGQWIPVTGGHDGITVLTVSLLGPWIAQNLYYFIIGSTIIAIWMLMNISKSSIGRSHQALRDDEDGAESLGIPVKKYKVNAFVFSAMLAAVAGIWYAHLSMVITPEVFSAGVSIQLLMMVVVGGMGSNLGAILGAIFIIVLPEFLYDFQDASMFIYGSIVLVILLFFPGGLAGIFKKVSKFLFHRKKYSGKESEVDVQNAS